LLEWFGKNARDLPWRRTRAPYAIWISEIMLQQTQVKTVMAYWPRWMATLPDAAAFARARPEQIHKLWEGLGYYARVRNAHAAAKLIVADFSGKFPRRFEEVLALPGIGRYTAGAICSIAYDEPAAILDGNVIRVLSRVFGVEGDVKGKETNAQLWALAQELVNWAERGKRGKLNEALMELGALVCVPREPRCDVCPWRQSCFARRENRVAEFPNLPKRAEVQQRRFIAFIVKQNGRFLARQRPAGVVNAHLWEFPNVEIASEEKNLANAAAPFVLTNEEAVCRVRHSITRYRILLEAYRADLPEAAEKDVIGEWKTAAQLERLAWTSAHRRVLEVIKQWSS
jgi:A/G-specific adenine glycosylase